MYPTPYKMQAVVDEEIDSMLGVDVIERSEAACSSKSPLVLVQKADGRVCINFR